MDDELSVATARKLLRGWDLQQEEFNRAREARFRIMFDVLEAQLPARFHALDLGCGPGSLSDRMLRRFPRARCVAVDRDPVGLTIGPKAVGSHGGRLRWVDADLGAPGWAANLGRPRFDAALSTTALHWLEPPRLRQLYRDLSRRIRPGGVVLNGDYLAWPARQHRMRSLVEAVRALRVSRKRSAEEWKAWEDWWRKAERTPGLGAAFAERHRRFPSTHPHPKSVDVEFHLRAFRDAGFREAGIVWQAFENRVLVAIR